MDITRIPSDHECPDCDACDGSFGAPHHDPHVHCLKDEWAQQLLGVFEVTC